MPTEISAITYIFKLVQTNRLYWDQMEKNLELKKQIKTQRKEIEELKDQTSDIPPKRPKLEIAALESRIDLTIDTTGDEDESSQSKIEEIEGRDSGHKNIVDIISGTNW